jgi:hypothetical protein
MSNLKSIALPAIVGTSVAVTFPMWQYYLIRTWPQRASSTSDK